MTDDWRLTVSLRDEREALDLVEVLHGVELEGRGEFAERVIVSHDEARAYLYAGSELQLEHAREVVDAALSKLGLGAMISVTVWHPIEQRWEDADLPLPRTEEEKERERRVRLERETQESLESGFAEWEVRVELPTHPDTVRLAQRLESEEIPVVRRHQYLLVGAANEDEAQALAARLGDEAPKGATIHIEPGGQMVWEVLPTNPFAVFGGLGT